MSVFNRLFRTKSNISKVELCRFKDPSTPFSEKGILLKLRHVFRGKNFPIIIPTWALQGMEEFYDANGKFSLEMVEGCNVLLEIQKSSTYGAKRRQVSSMKKKMGIKGEVVDERKARKEFGRKQEELKRKQKEAEKLKRQLEEQQKMLKGRKAA
jgi:hypothetical protein|tara:strand:- start:766 stop:1227 length:462 start_codon:yes stop_codon:yes gene_type:complete